MKRMILRAAVVACGFLAMVRGLEAAPLDTRIPADAVIYAGWAGADALAPAYGESNLKGVMDNTKVGDYVRDNWTKWMEKAQENGADAKDIEEGAAMMKMLWKHPVAMYVGPMGFKDPKMPSFRVAFLVDAGADAGALMDWHKKLMAKNPAPPEAKMQVALDGTVVILTFGDVSPDVFMNKDEGFVVGRLPTAPAYVAAMKGMEKDPAVALYVDAAKIIATIQEGVEKAPDSPAEAKKAVPAVIQALGLNGLTQVAMTGGFDKKEWSETGFVGTKGARVGLLALLDGDPVSDGALAMVPKDVGAMNIGRMDLMKVMAIVRDVIGKVDPKAPAEFEKALAEIQKQTGIDVEKNLINAFGDEWIGYRGPATEQGDYPFAMVQKLRDGAALAKALEVIEEKVNEAAEGKVKIEKMDAGKFEVKGVRLPQMMAGTPSSIAWTIRGGVLYITTIEGMDASVAQVEGKGESITGNPGYKAVRAALPQVKATMVSYVDPSKLYPGMYRQLMATLPLARLAGVDLPEDLLPSPKKVSGFLTPSGAVSWSDADGFHFASRSAFPGSELLSGQTSPSVMAGAVAMGAMVAIPPVHAARTRAVAVRSQMGMRQILMGCMMYENENEVLPDHLGRLLLGDGGVISENLVKYESGTKALEVTAEMKEAAKKDFPAFAKLVDAHCDYEYLGHGLKISDAGTPSATVLCYEKAPTPSGSGMSLGFFDGHVEMVSWDKLPEVFKATNEVLKKNKLAEVDVDALVKAGKGN